MEGVRFFNCGRHELTPEQRWKAVEQFGATEFADLQFLNPSLHEALTQMGDDTDINELAFRLNDWLLENQGASVVHLSIGSPAFMFAFAGITAVWRSVYGASYPILVFSHLNRIVESGTTPDGKVRKRHINKFCCYQIVYGRRDQ